MARRRATFGQRNTISQGLASTRPVRYDVDKTDAQEIAEAGEESAAHRAKMRLEGGIGKKTAPDKGKASLHVLEIKDEVVAKILEQIDVTEVAKLTRDELVNEVELIIAEVVGELKVLLNHNEQIELVRMCLNEMLGLGPLEPLLDQEDVTDILVNGAKQVYVERGGKLELTNINFRDDEHVMNLASRIVTQVGRRIDRASPLVDARLKDGSRVNVIVPPLAIKGPTISIRKFSKKPIHLEQMVKQGNVSKDMATVLKIAAACRLNIVISGGTGSGKTTLLNALSALIDPGERIVTIEDAAELQLQQPHVVSLETRPANLEGEGEITIRDLVRNALRMRPDRIVLGEIRGAEAIDMLQAMNTGHDGSMSTLHANRPREALTRLENMVNMSNMNLSSLAIRSQIAEAVNLVIQISRMRDGMRRVTGISEITGLEGEIIVMQDLFNYHYESEDEHGMLVGTFETTGMRPAMFEKARYYGLEQALMRAM